MLASVGFTPALQSTPVGSLSGGWKMKLALGKCHAHDAIPSPAACAIVPWLLMVFNLYRACSAAAGR